MQKGAIFTIVSKGTTLLFLFVQKVDDAIRLKNLDPVDSAIGFFNIYRLDSDLSGGSRYPTFEQRGLVGLNIRKEEYILIPCFLTNFLSTKSLLSLSNTEILREEHVK